MRLIPSDPDVETIVSRIKQNEINLQPDFQRGEVWSDVKKRRLIDSILRNWHVPPIHVVEVPGGGVPEVLDGQQRLVAIRDFVDGAVKVDGRIEPGDPEIALLHGLTYHQLPTEWRRKFNRFSIRIFNITDYRPGEPAELFYRLNQPVTLTTAEQRNAFFGPSRTQVRHLVSVLLRTGANREFLGFSNSRMSYDDVLARLCAQLEAGTLRAKVTASTLATRYRSETGFEPDAMRLAEDAVVCFGHSRQFVHHPVHFNKATLFSWLWFAASATLTHREDFQPQILGEYLDFFEYQRAEKRYSTEPLALDGTSVSPGRVKELFDIYDDRASSRVLDTSSVLARDIVIWVLFVAFLTRQRVAFAHDSRFSLITNSNQEAADGEALVEGLIAARWGELR